MRDLRLLMSCAAMWAIFLSGPAFAQGAADAYPSKSVLIIVPYAPGGPADKETRIYATKLSSLTGQQFVMDYKPGATTTIGTGYAAKAAPDGYTLLMVTTAFTVLPATYKDLPFDVVKDFAPLSLMSKRYTVVVVRPSFPAKTFTDYIAYAKANPGKINYGATGTGGIIHLAGAWMHSATKTKVTFVQYKGGGPAMLDLVAGRLDVTSTSLVSALPLIKAGKIRPIAIQNNERFKGLPELPTVAEMGVPGYDYSGWQGFLAPAGVPASIVNKLSETLVRAAKAPEVSGPLERNGSVMVGSTPAQFRQVITREVAQWKKIVQDAGIVMEQ